MKGSVYERQVDRVLTGGWNLLPPGDLIGAADALQMENFRVTSAGSLRSRLGHGAPIFNTGAVQQFCLVKGATPRRYSAAYLGTLYHDATPIGNFGLGAKIGMVSYQGYLWAMSNTLQKKDKGAGLIAWTPAAPLVAPTLTPTLGGIDGAAGPIGKTYTYWVTYTTADNQESPSSPGATITVADPHAITTISSPADPSDPQRTHYNVYRVGDTLQQALRLNPAPILLGVDFVDSYDPADGLGDYQLTQLGLALDPNASGPPPGNGLAGPYYDHLLAWGVIAHPNRLYWSGTLQPYNFPGSALDEGNHVDIGELGEAIVGVTIRPRVATIYKTSSIWRLVGDPDDLNSDLERVTDVVGAMSPPIAVGSNDYFEGKEGIYSYNGERPQKISGKLDRLFLGEQPEDHGFAYPALIPLEQNPEARALNRLGHRNGRLYFFYCGIGQAAPLPNRGMVVELGADNWGSDSRGVTALLDEGQDGNLLGCVSTFGSAVYSMEEGSTDSGQPIPIAYHSGFKDQGAPEQVKTYADVVIEHNTGGATLGVGAYYNNGQGPAPKKLPAPQEPLGLISSTKRTVSVFQLAASSDKLGIQARNIAIRIEGDTTVPVEIYKIAVHYFVEPRDSETYDSDETDLGTEKVKLVDELELDIDYAAANGGPINVAVVSDRPNPGFTFTSTLNQTNGRETVRIPVSQGNAVAIEGRLLRVTLSSSVSGSTFKLYGVRLRVLPYGEYIDNARGESFVTVPINVGMT